MKLPDTNVLLYAVNTDAPQHAIAHDWLMQAFAQPAGVGLAWTALLGFLRIAVRPDIFAKPLKIDSALQTVAFWTEHPRARILHPSTKHATLLGELLGAVRGGSSLVTDAHLAALAIEHGATLGSFDRDFIRFEALRFEHLRV